MYFSRILDTTSSGKGGGGLFLSQVVAESQSRTNCLSKEGWVAAAAGPGKLEMVAMANGPTLPQIGNVEADCRTSQFFLTPRQPNGSQAKEKPPAGKSLSRTQREDNLRSGRARRCPIWATPPKPHPVGIGASLAEPLHGTGRLRGLGSAHCGRVLAGGLSAVYQLRRRELRVGQ